MLIDLLRSTARSAPDTVAVISDDTPTTYRSLLDRSEALARGIRRSDLTRFGCRVDNVPELVALLTGASAVGAEPCIYPAGATADEIDELATRFDHAVVVTDGEIESLRVVTTEAHSLSSCEGNRPQSSSTAPLLVLTTGTTGAVKGVHHDWNRLYAGLRLTNAVPGARWLLAYNLNQFAGLQVLLYALASSATLVVPSSNRPREAIHSMEAHQVTHASATPTFWRFLVSVLDPEAASRLPLRQITLGGEAVPESLLSRLAELFPRARISQVYASTEFGSGVSVNDRQSGLPLSVLERGADADVQYRIVGDELHARSTVGMVRYFGDVEEGGGWRPTGDLVAVQDGRIHFVGRASDTINVGGVKVHPLPIEDIINAVDGVDLAHAFGRPNPIAGQIVVVDVVATPGTDPETLDRDIRAACDQLPMAARPRRIRFVTSIDVRGGKVVRRNREDDRD